MNDLEQSLHRIVDLLRSWSTPFALVGGLAVSARVEPRFTRDADLAIAVDDDHEAGQLLGRLRRSGYEVAALVEQERADRLATARLQPADSPDGIITDLLFASSGIEIEIVRDADVLSILPGLELPVASVGHLIAMKLLARDDRRRPTDADDLNALMGVATPSDWQAAEAAVGLIVTRGYNRDRDLVSALANLRRDGAY